MWSHSQESLAEGDSQEHKLLCEASEAVMRKPPSALLQLETRLISSEDRGQSCS